MRMSGKKIIVVMVILLVAVWVWHATDGSRSDVLRVGLYDNPPKVYRNDQGQAAGLFIELLEAMARQEGWRLEFVDGTWTQCLERLEAGEIDLMPDVARTPLREQRFDFHAIPVAHSWSSLWSRGDVDILAWPDLAGKRVAVLRGAVQERALSRITDGLGIRVEEVPVDGMAAGFEAVVSGRADVTVTNSFFGGMYGYRYGLKENPLIFSPATLYFAVAQGQHPELLQRIDDYLSQWRLDGDSVYYQALKRAMTRPLQPVVPLHWLRWAAVGGALLLILLVATGLLRWQVRRRTRDLVQLNQRLSHLLETSPVMLYQVAVTPPEFEPLWVSDNVKRLFGYTREQVLTKGWWPKAVHPEDHDRARVSLVQIRQNGFATLEYRIFDAAGRVRYLRDEMHYVPGHAGQPAEIVGSWSDLTVTREQEDQLSFLRQYDPLTQLPNRTLLRHQLQEHLKQAKTASSELTVLSLDLDHFKKINETFGFELGDKVLRKISSRLKDLLRLEDTLARMGADEFVLLLRGEHPAELAASVGRRILQSLSAPLTIDDQHFVITASIGISLYPLDGMDEETLLKHAELARYAAKRQGRNQFQFYSQELSVTVRDHLVMENALRHAVVRDELILHYQPQVALASGALVGVEALVRWQSAELGLVPPNQFIPRAEETGQINEIGLWVIEEACRQMVDWEQKGCMIPRVAVNLAVQQIEAGDLPQQVLDILQRTGLGAERLELEVTESTLMREPEKVARALADFRALGIHLAIDDFGTGYSSLAYLKRLPLDRLKIDRSFVLDIGTNPEDDIISRAVINLSNSLGMETVAEGIERPQQLEFLRREGCEIGQGFLFSRPLPAEALMAYADQPGEYGFLS
ncbi:MAG: EAL domain-containing protein [Desulfuromonadaceae bacterium]|nr:EAL domain-containing protein [Desulfuromonadaceae bacterium]